MVFRFKRIPKVIIITLLLAVFLWVRFHPMPRGLIADLFAPVLVKKKDLELQLRNESVVPKTKIELIKENKRLREEIDNLKLRLREFRSIKLENGELRGLLEIQNYRESNYITAQIISRDSATGGMRLRVNKGAVHGILIGQAVLARGLLYGRVLEISHETALILTIYDPNCKVSVNIVGTNIHGILFGRGQDRWKAFPNCLIKYLPRDFDYQSGMEVETSAFGTMIPANIPVGTLTQESNGEVTMLIDNLYRIARLKPLDRLEKINFVTIVTKLQD